MKTLIIGASGTIGKEITKLSQEKGYTVIQTSRKANPSIDIDDPNSINSYFNELSSLDSIICVAGNASFGKLADLDNDQINLGLRSKLLGQVNVVKKGLQKLNPGGTIVLTGGMLAYSPWPETSNIAMVNAGLEGFVKAVSLELEDDKRVLIVHPPLLSESASNMGMDSSPWPSANTVAKTYISAIENKSEESTVFVDGYFPD